MDSTISTAVDEICLQGHAGVSLQNLWRTLNIQLSPGVKKATWLNLLAIPSLQFQSPNGGITYAPSDPQIGSFVFAEKLNVKIVAKQHLRDTFLGLDGDYSVDTNNYRQHQIALDRYRRILERIAMSRKNGITQSELAKEFGMEGKYLFYDVRKLEARGLIVRQPAVLKIKETANAGELKNNPSVTTRLLYFYLYAHHLGAQQRFVITKEGRASESLGTVNVSDVGGCDSFEECFEDDVLIKDYEPAMKDVCDKLEESSGKVLVVSDIKQDLGYRGPSGHKAWRTIRRLLKDASIVEEFDAKVNEKVERCLRLKKSTLQNLEPQTPEYRKNDLDKLNLIKLGRKCQVTEQLLELPILYQVYDMIDAAGSEGLPVIEICERLGIDNKSNHTWLHNMFHRFGMQIRKQSHGKTDVYRVWTSSNFNAEPFKAILASSESVRENTNCDLDVPEISVPTFPECDRLPSLGDNEVNTQLPEDPRESTPPASLKLLKCRSVQRYPCHSLSVDNARREERILERLQDEKFILRAELYKWLVNLEKDKCTKMDRKTVYRILEKLQQQGKCKCVHVNVPCVADSGRSRITQVFLHPSVQNSVEKLHTEIIDKMRSFENQCRGQSLSRGKEDESLPVLCDIKRSQPCTDTKSSGPESMRVNGFVLAKMVRAKLLHKFLWTYISSSTDLDDALSLTNHVYELKNPHITYKLFSLETAIRAIPIELFLQVVGSTMGFDDLIEKCKKGLCLSDLSREEYKAFRNVQANSRLSLVIDILRRVKLIRIVNNGHSDDGVKIPHATFTHALELKTYIEEPLSVVSISGNFTSLDLRPRIRHDFVLSNEEAVDEFWETLEYCYAVADPRAASHAFPGYAVHEVFRFKSWASVRVMTVDQRAEVIKRIPKGKKDEKPPLKECRRIAKDLNLTIEQVLRVYKDRKRRHNRLQDDSDARGEDQPVKSKRSSRKRKKFLEGNSREQTKVDTVSEEMEKKRFANLSNIVDHFTEDQVLHTPEEHLQEFEDDGDLNALEEPGSNENEECYSYISQCAYSKMKPTRQRRFVWTNEADRQLVILYARHRASLGPKFHRTDWSSLPELPAPPSKCGKRMAALMRNRRFRKAMMRLCNVLGENYAKHLERTENNNDYGQLPQSSARKVLSRDSLNDVVQHPQETLFQEKQWDDFDGEFIKIALAEVLQCKQMAKLETSLRAEPVSKQYSNLSMGAEQNDSTESGLPPVPSDSIQPHDQQRRNDSAQTSRSQRLHKKIMKAMNERISVSSEVCDSLAVSNAVELLKIIFLSTSTAAEAGNRLAETLRRYSERDLFAAFSYLREKNIMIGGTGDQPYRLSQRFLGAVSKSPFPANTGNKAAKFSSWLCEEEKNLMDGETCLSEHLECGDIFHLFALVSAGELSISPCLPDDGSVGEAEDARGVKRRTEVSESCASYNAKRLKSMTECEFENRRKKGFPGISVSVNRETMSRTNVIELFRDEKTCCGTLQLYENDGFKTRLDQKIGSSSNPSKCNENINFGTISISENSGESSWEVLTSYAEHLILKPCDQVQGQQVNPDVFKAVHTAIQEAGDRGLNLEEVSQVLDTPGENVPELVVDVLQTFGRALKVNAYDSVRVVDALYHSKYFLTSMVGSNFDCFSPSSITTPRKNGAGGSGLQPQNHNIGFTSSLGKVSMSVDNVHKATTRNRPEDVAATLDGFQIGNVHEGSDVQNQIVEPGGDNEGKINKFTSEELCRPILPWVNGDGTINRIVYKGLVRRILGIVMQNPGILEDDIICRMDVLNPQNCKTLLELLILDKHLTVRRLHQTTGSGQPSLLLARASASKLRQPKMVSREHFFVNPMSTFLL